MNNTIIDPDTDQLVFVRFKDRAIFELVVANAAGAWVWYEAAFCRKEQKTYLIETEIGEPPEIPVLCHDDELAAFFWADPDLVPPTRIKLLTGGPCMRLPVLPSFLQGEQLPTWCESLGYAAEMVPCVLCQDLFPIDATIPEDYQRPCPHIGWCSKCQMWSSPSWPGKEAEMEQCPHRIEDDLYLLDSRNSESTR